MDLNEFRREMLDELRASAIANVSDVTTEFLSYYSEILISAEEMTDFNESYFEATGKGNKKIQIDGYQFDEVDNSCVLVIADFSNDSLEERIATSAINKYYSRVEAFIQNSLNGFIESNFEQSTAAYDLSLRIKEEEKRITKFRILIYSDRILSDRIKSLKKDDLFGKPVELNVWDISRIFELVKSSHGKESIEIDFADFNLNGLQAVKGYSSDIEEYEAYLMTLPGDLLAEVYLQYGSRLLEGNVRSFLSTRGKVNKSIRETIMKRPEMFFAYNNGIAATATEIDIEEKGESLYIKKIMNLQIINGGQTTASIANALLNNEGDISKVFVPMKLSVVDKEKADQIIPEISKSANSQNKVSDADFMSNHGFHIRMEEFSRKTPAPAVDGNQYQTKWFYERARGQYIQAQMKLTMAEKKKFKLKNPKQQVIMKVDLAKYMNTYHEKPHIVSKGSQSNARDFDSEMRRQWEKSDTDFNMLYYKKVVSMAIIYKTTERIVSNLEWYKRIRSYRANIVTYTIALIINEARKRGKMINLNEIWLSQKIQLTLEKQIEITSKEVFDYITKEDRPTLNVTEWCKKELCWKNAKEEDWTFVNDFASILVDPRIDDEEKKEEKLNQTVRNDIVDQTEVISKGEKFWRDLQDWADKRKLLSDVEKDFLQIAIKVERTGKIPSPRQARKIIDIRDKVSLEGYDW